MSLFELTFALTSIMLGLALTQIASAAHNLALAGSRVKWAPEPVLLTLLVIIIVVFVWLDQWQERHLDSITVGRTLLQVAKMMTLYFAAASCLPEPERGSETLDMQEYYYRTRGLSYGALIVGLILFQLYAMTARPLVAGWWILIALALPCVYLIPIFVRWRPVHLVVLIVVLVYFCQGVVGQTIRQ